jgi:predicted MFS family arabinose efflux permease
MAEVPQTASAEWRNHWSLVLTSMVGMSFYSLVSYSLGTFIEPIESEFGWGRAQISVGLTIFTLTAMIGAPFMGAAIDFFGTRRIAILGVTAHALAFSALSLASGSLVQWYCLWAMLAVAALSTKTLVWSVAVSSVFSAGRGLALACVLSGTALGQTLAPLVTHNLIEQFGWRQAYVFLSAGWGGLALLLVLAFFFDARENGRRDRPAVTRVANLGGLTLSEAFRDRRILRIAAAEVFVSAMASGVMIHMVPVLSDAGLARASAIEIAALAGVSGLVGKLLVGWLLDRVQGSWIPCLSFALQALGYFLLLNTFDSIILLSLGVSIMGFTVGACLQVTTYLITRYAGLQNYGKIFGFIISMMMIGASIGPLLAGYVFDTVGTYAPLLTLAIPVVLVSSLLFLGLGAYPIFEAEAGAEADRIVA